MSDTWISCKERMPEYDEVCIFTDGQRVLMASTYRTNESIWFEAVGWYGGDDWWFDFEPEEATHWMPVPKAPEL